MKVTLATQREANTQTGDDHCILCVSGDKEQNYKKNSMFSVTALYFSNAALAISHFCSSAKSIHRQHYESNDSKGQ